MKVEYQSQKTGRIKRNFFFGVRDNFEDYWFVDKLGKWLHKDDPLCKGARGSHHSVLRTKYRKKSAPRTIKAFQRYLRKHSAYLPEGKVFIFCNRIQGYDVYGRIPKY